MYVWDASTLGFYRPNQAIARGILPGRSALAGLRRLGQARRRLHFGQDSQDAAIALQQLQTPVAVDTTPTELPASFNTLDPTSAFNAAGLAPLTATGPGQGVTYTATPVRASGAGAPVLTPAWYSQTNPTLGISNQTLLIGLAAIAAVALLGGGNGGSRRRR